MTILDNRRYQKTLSYADAWPCPRTRRLHATRRIPGPVHHVRPPLRFYDPSDPSFMLPHGTLRHAPRRAPSRWR